MVHIISNSSNIVVNTKPVIRFDNGMTLCLSEKPGSFELSSHDWNKILQINAMVRTMGMYRDRYVIERTVQREVPKTLFQKLKKWMKF